MSEDKLLPCPFCGSYHFEPEILNDEDGTWSVNCFANVEGGCGLHMEGYTTKEYAIKAWNTRAQPQTVERDVQEALDAITNGLTSLSIEERDCYQSGFSSEGLRLANIGSQIGAALQTIHSHLTAQQQDVNKDLLDVMKAVLDHVEDESAKRVGSQCTLCFSYRKMMRGAITRAEQKDQNHE